MSGSNLSPDSANNLSNGSDTPAEPLGLTVHSLPSPGATEAAVGGMRSGGRLKMLLVLLVCAAPVIASYFTYYVLRPEGRRNFGELIDPQRPLPDLPVVSLDGTPHNLTELKGQWLLVSVASGVCDDQCEQHLYLQRQVLTSLGKERDRFDWVWLVTDDQPVRAALLPALKDAVVFRLKPGQAANWLAPAKDHQLSDHLYVVDPIGNWMMRFPAKLDAEGATKAKRDLERLLRASAAWDQAGRGDK